MKKINYVLRYCINVSKISGCIVFASAITLYACKKQSHNSEEAIMNLDKNGLEYINLPAGKYYIYKDSANGELDSVVITKSALESFHVPAYHGGLFDSYPAYTYQSMTLVISKLKPAPSEDWLNAKTTTPSYPYDTDSAFIFLQANDNSIAFNYPLLVANAEFLPALTVENKPYSDVIQYTDDSGFPVDNPLYKKRIYYWAKNIGLIKFVTITTGDISKVFNLVRNN